MTVHIDVRCVLIVDDFDVKSACVDHSGLVLLAERTVVLHLLFANG